MKISVAICTWNRSRLLRRTLQQLTAMVAEPRFKWELIVIDNNSSDDTQDVIQRFTNTLPIRSEVEPEQGHSRSRNRAIRAASGDYVVWTDDDVLVSPNWLGEYFDAFSREPDMAFFGGPILPCFEPPGCPKWLEETWEKCKPAFATRLLGDEPIELNSSRLPYGANFAVRTDIQRANEFCTHLGRVGTGMVGGDETDVLKRIISAGGTGRWVPRATLEHIIPPDRATEKYIRSYFVGQGFENVFAGKHDRGTIASLCDATRMTLRYRLKRDASDPDQWVSHMIRASISWGQFLALRSKAQSPRPGESEDAV